MPKKSNFMRYEELGIKMEDEDTFIKEEPIEDLSAVPKGICDESWKRLHGNASSVCSERENGHTQGAQGIDAPSSKCEEMCFKAEIEDVYVKEEPMEDLSTTLAGPCEEDEERLQLDASSLRMKEEASGDPGSKGTKISSHAATYEVNLDVDGCSSHSPSSPTPPTPSSTLPSPSPTPTPATSSKKKKLDSINDNIFEAAIKRLSQPQEEEDECKTFGKSIGMQLREVKTENPLQAKIAKKVIQDVIFIASINSLNVTSKITSDD